MAKVYQKINLYNESAINLRLTVNDSVSGFAVSAGVGTTGVGFTGLISTGVSFSGYDGYLFDQSGHFFGGYEYNVPFNIAIHNKSDGKLSYYHKNRLIANNIDSSTFDYIEFEKYDASLNITVSGELGADQSAGITGQGLLFSGDFLSMSGNLLFF